MGKAMLSLLGAEEPRRSNPQYFLLLHPWRGLASQILLDLYML